MPGGDRTGPAGMGPMTGGGFGYCAGYAAPGYATVPWARGYGGGRAWGRRGGRGYRHWYYATGLPGWIRSGPFPLPALPWATAPVGFARTPEQELGALRQQAGYFERALEELRTRIHEVELQGGGSTEAPASKTP